MFHDLEHFPFEVTVSTKQFVTQNMPEMFWDAPSMLKKQAGVGIFRKISRLAVKAGEL